MRMKIVKARRTDEQQLQTSEYAPRGPVRLAPLAKAKVPTLLPRAPFSVPEEQRVSGRIYDWHSGIMLGLASDELRAAQKAGVPFDRIVGGVKQRVEIHP
jgi:hypothetical protein